jgi:site-specific DNA recombinase
MRPSLVFAIAIMFRCRTFTENPKQHLLSRLQHGKKCSTRQVSMTLSLAFLAPDLVRAAVDGRLPRGVGVEPAS